MASLIQGLVNTGIAVGEEALSHTLLLNADAQPVSYLPLSAIRWREAVTYLWLDKVTVLDWYDDWIVHSASWETRVPVSYTHLTLPTILLV